MTRTLLIVFAAAFAVAACGGSSEETKTAAEAKGTLSATDQLKALSVDLQAGMDALMQPINDTESLVNDITNLPAKLNLNATTLMSMAKATLDSGTVSISADLNLDANAKAEVEATLNKLKGIVQGLKAVPDRVQGLAAKATAALAQVPVLTAQVTTSAQATMANPFASAESKTQAQAELNGVAQIQTDVNAQIQNIQKNIAEIPTLAASALAKLAASFTS